MAGRWRRYVERRCDEHGTHTWDVVDRETGSTVEQQLPTRAEARRIAFERESEAVLARLRGH